ncbi:MAG: V-type ATP synthase subunit K [Spirochaetaceae bacterium]|nr:V-type ATP synthase subunit K [Spirochaetaceae bacterium]
MDLVNFAAAAVLGISGVGSAIGLMIAGSGAIGAWKKCFMNNKQAPGTMIVFAGAPLTQTLYGYLLMSFMTRNAGNAAKSPWLLFGMGLICSIAIAASAIAQGVASASAADALAETGEGGSKFLMVVGLCETVAIFVMAFCIIFLL